MIKKRTIQRLVWPDTCEEMAWLQRELELPHPPFIGNIVCDLYEPEPTSPRIQRWERKMHGFSDDDFPGGDIPGARFYFTIFLTGNASDETAQKVSDFVKKSRVHVAGFTPYTLSFGTEIHYRKGEDIVKTAMRECKSILRHLHLGHVPPALGTFQERKSAKRGFWQDRTENTWYRLLPFWRKRRNAQKQQPAS